MLGSAIFNSPHLAANLELVRNCPIIRLSFLLRLGRWGASIPLTAPWRGDRVWCVPAVSDGSAAKRRPDRWPAPVPVPVSDVPVCQSIILSKMVFLGRLGRNVESN